MPLKGRPRMWPANRGRTTFSDQLAALTDTRDPPEGDTSFMIFAVLFPQLHPAQPDRPTLPAMASITTR